MFKERAEKTTVWLGRLPFGVRPSLHVDMELADALGLHHVVVNVAHGDGVGGVGVGVRGLARISHVSSKVVDAR